VAILKIARLGHPILRTAADPVTDPTAPDIRRLIADMTETLLDAGGIGLAPPQVHVPLRLFLWREGAVIRSIINPEMAAFGEARDASWEGCLSIPGLRGLVDRPAAVAFRGTDLEVGPVEGLAEGLTARVFQHENDHLDGVTYLMRMSDLSQLGFDAELARFRDSFA
jgi:peptide deformylase